jgi:DNA-binding MarR family transcriptional regulator
MAAIMTTAKETFSLEHYKVEDSVGYLLGRAKTMLAKSLDVALVEYGITHAQGSIVLMLSTGKYSTAADLARELYIDSASMTRMIDRLEKRGLILRVRRGDDRRIINLRLTPDGEGLAQRLPSIYVAVLNRNFVGFSTEELDLLRSLLRKLLANQATVDDAETIGKPL